MMYGDLNPVIKGVFLLFLQFIFWRNAYQVIRCFLHRNNKLQAIGMGDIMVLDYFLMQVEMTSIHAMETGDFNTVVPYARGDSLVWVHFLLGGIFFALSLIFGIRTGKGRRDTLSPLAVKEALDALPTGICFYEPNGRVLLKNQVMEQISREIRGISLLNGNLFYDDKQSLIHLKDGRSYLMHRESTVFQNKAIYLLTAVEVTREYAEADLLREQQEKAKRLSERIKDYRKQIKETTIEEETLRAKVRIHDELGEALLAGKRFLKMQGDDAEAKKLLDLLERNAALLKNEQPEVVRNPYEQVFKTAGNLDVTLDITGELPLKTAQQKIFATALHECITNTLRHAGGNRIEMKIDTGEDIIHAELTNNGKPPAGPIRESGGLAQLHKLVDAAGGAMEIDWSPVFLLRITLPTEVNEYGL